VKRAALLTLGCMAALLALPQWPAHAQSTLSPAEAQAIAVDAYLYFYPLLSDGRLAETFHEHRTREGI
jgi:hypothetical protein